MCLSDRFPGDAYAAGTGTIVRATVLLVREGKWRLINLFMFPTGVMENEEESKAWPLHFLALGPWGNHLASRSRSVLTFTGLSYPFPR